MLVLDDNFVSCLIRKSLVCCLRNCWSNPFFVRPLKTHEGWPYSHHFNWHDFLNLYFLVFVSFCFDLYFVFYVLLFFFNFFYFKTKYFSQKIPLKIYFKNSFRVIRIKISLFFLKKNMQPYLDRFASFENFGFEQNTNQSLWSQINGIILG